MSKPKDVKFLKTKPSIPMPPKVNGSTVYDSALKSDSSKKNNIPSNHIDEDLGIKKWKIGKLIGGGASGSVFKALNIKTGVLAAVKKIVYSNEDL